MFLDGFRVKTFGSTFWVGGSEIQNYTIIGDKIFIQSKKDDDKSDFQTMDFRVVDNGYKLVRQTDDANIIMRKVY